MSELVHPAAPHHLPAFIPAADGSDPLFSFVVVTILLLVMAVGILYLKLHSLPERVAHRHGSTQLQLIAVLAVLALFTHNNVFWVLALLLSVVRLPDFATPLNSIADSLRQLANRDQPVPGNRADSVDRADSAAVQSNEEEH